MFYFMTITLMIAAVVLIGLSVVFRDEVMENLSVPPALKFIHVLLSLVLHASVILAIIMAITFASYHEDEDKILNDIIKNGTKPKVQYNIVDGDTIVNDTYYSVPDDTTGLRYPISRVTHYERGDGDQ